MSYIEKEHIFTYESGQRNRMYQNNKEKLIKNLTN